MSTGRIILVTVLAGTLGVAAGVIVNRMQQPTVTPGQAPSMVDVGTRDSLPDFSYPDLAGKQIHSRDWHGKVVILNFWASWCPPCRREMPALIALQNDFTDRGLQIIGLAIDEESAVQEYVTTLGLNYPILLGDSAAADISRELGNRFRGLPFTVVFDRKGKLAYAQAGEVSRKTLEEKISPLL